MENYSELPWSYRPTQKDRKAYKKRKLEQLNKDTGRWDIGDRKMMRNETESSFLNSALADAETYAALMDTGIFVRERLRDIPGLHKDELMKVLDNTAKNESYINDSYIPQLEKYKENMKKVVVVTSTFYKNNPEGHTRSQLALQSLKNASRCGLRSVVIDGGSNEQFLEQIKSIPGVTVVKSSDYPQAQNMGAERRVALQYALQHFQDTPYFLWTEPEKDDLLTVYNLGPMIEHMSDQQYDVIVPQRSPASKLTLPVFQARTERRANKELYNLMQQDKSSDPKPSVAEPMDYFFGPKLMSRSGAEDMLSYDGTSRDGIVLPVIISFQKGKKVGSHQVDYYYDPKQTDLEEGRNGDAPIDEQTKKQYMRKRIEQYQFILNKAKEL